MVSFAVFVDPADLVEAVGAIGEGAFADTVFCHVGVPLPDPVVTVDPRLAPGHVAVAVDGRRGPVQLNHAGAALWATVQALGAALVDDDTAQLMLDLLHDRHPALVASAEACFTTPFLRARLQALLAEGVPVVDLRRILEALLDVLGRVQVPPGADPDAWQPGPAVFDREVRIALREAIVTPHLRDGVLVLYLVHDRWREALAAGLDEADVARLRHDVDATVASEPVLIIDDDVRAALWAALAPHRRDVTVLGYGELWPAVDVRPIGQVGGEPCQR